MSEYPGKLQVRCATCRLLRNPGETLARRKRKIKGRGRPGDIRNARPGRTLNVTVASIVDVEPHTSGLVPQEVQVSSENSGFEVK
jgi:hypothetical protein